MKVPPIRFAGQLRMGAVIGKQDRHEKSRSVVGVLAAGALAGVLAGAVALGVAELAAALVGPASAPVIAVGETAINLTPVPREPWSRWCGWRGPRRPAAGRRWPRAP